MNFKTDKTLVSVAPAYGFIILSLFEYTLIFSKILVVDIIWCSVSLPLGMIAAVSVPVKNAEVAEVNKGSFASAAAFEFICAFVYGFSYFLLSEKFQGKSSDNDCSE